jgi:hypothetical protein
VRDSRGWSRIASELIYVAHNLNGTTGNAQVYVRRWQPAGLGKLGSRVSGDTGLSCHQGR